MDNLASEPLAEARAEHAPRVRIALDGPLQANARTLRCPDRVVDRREGVVICGARPPAHLSPTELRLLNYLADRPNQVVNRDALWEAVWHQEPAIQSRAIDKTIRRLRTKIERDPANPALIESVYGVGYRLNLGPSAAAGAPAPVVVGNAPLIGREHDLRALLAGTAEGVPHVLLAGAAGVGKSRLALAFARTMTAQLGLRCEAAIDLTGVNEEREALTRIGGGVGVEACMDLGALGRRLGELGPCSLIVDDVEGVAAFVRELARRTTVTAPDLRLVLTSRVALGGPSTRVIMVEPLAVEAAAELFVTRMRRASPPALRAWYAPDVHAHVVGLVRRLDRLPLALELAAARTSVMGPRELEAHLARRLDLLSDPMGSAGGRHASMRGALDGTWALLSAREREVLMRCASIEGAFTLATARAVITPGASTGAPADVLDVLHRLVAYSLVMSVDEDGGEPRLVLMECVRDYALERLVAPES